MKHMKRADWIEMKRKEREDRLDQAIEAWQNDSGEYAVWVECPTCGAFSIDDVEVIEMESSTAYWRCPNCNDFHTTAVMILD